MTTGILNDTKGVAQRLLPIRRGDQIKCYIKPNSRLTKRKLKLKFAGEPEIRVGRLKRIFTGRKSYRRPYKIHGCTEVISSIILS